MKQRKGLEDAKTKKTKIGIRVGKKFSSVHRLCSLANPKERWNQCMRSSAMPVDIKSADIKQIWPKISPVYGPGCLRLYPESSLGGRAPPPRSRIRSEPGDAAGPSCRADYARNWRSSL